VSEASFFETSFVLFFAAMYVLGGINGIYICFSGIRKMDLLFSQERRPEFESVSPFDRVLRMHRYAFKYCFSRVRPRVGFFMSFWLFFTCVSLVFYWLALSVGFVAMVFDFNPSLYL